MRLSQEDWLPKARALAVGRTDRIFHGRESRPNLVIGNESGHYWAYCQACKQGGKVHKDHVLVLGTKPPKTSTVLSLPRDMVRLESADQFVQDSIARFLASKSMDALYLPSLWYSEERKRLLIQTKQGWLGRDLTGNSHQKWLTYNPKCTHLSDNIGEHVIIVEDAFSWYKTKHALSRRETTRHWSCVCLLGTEIRPALMQELSRCASTLHAFLDGDSAGQAGALRASRKCRAFGITAVARCAPTDFDPKDLTLQRVREECLLAEEIACGRVSKRTTGGGSD